MKRTLAFMVVAAMSLGAGAADVELPSPQPAENTPYSTVAAYLNPGGEIYFYLGTKQWCSQMDGLLGKLDRLLEIMPETEEKQVGTAVFQLVRQFVNECGLRELEGIGFSAVKELGGLYHNRFVCSRPGQASSQGLMWKMVDAENTPLKSKLDWLPMNTVLASWGPCRLQPVWQWVKQGLKNTGNSTLIQGFQAGVDQLEQHGIALDPWLSSLADHVAMVVTVEPEKTEYLHQGRVVFAKYYGQGPGLTLIVPLELYSRQ